MKIFGTVHTPVERGANNLKLGRLVANLGFLEALLSYGTYDQYHLFLPSIRNIKTVEGFLKERFSDGPLLDRITLSHHLHLIDALQNQNFTVFHTNGWYRYIPGLAHLRARHSAHPFAITGVIHSLHTLGLIREIRGLMAAPITSYDSVVCTSDAGREVFRRYMALESGAQPPDHGSPLRLDRIPLGVNESLLEPADRLEARKRQGLPSDATIALYFGRISPVTKADLAPLFDVVAKLSVKHPSLRLVISGGANKAQRVWIEGQIARVNGGEIILFRPNVDDDVKRDFLTGSDFFVSPVDNLQETFGISIVEAMASGLPVIASDFNGYRELVDHGITGFKVPTTWSPLPDIYTEMSPLLENSIAQMVTAQSIALDLGSLANQMEALITNPALRQAMGDAGRAKVRENYTWRTVVHQYEALWDALKADADAQGIPQTQAPHPNATRYFPIFSHYVTRTLQPENMVIKGPLFQMRDGDTIHVPQTSEDLDPVTLPDLIVHLLCEVHGGASTVGDLVASAEEKLGVSEAATHFHLLRLLKIGLLALQ